MNATLNLIAIGLVVLATVGIGAFGLRISRTTGDFYVASRTVSPWMNASAIGGEYLSAASFLGVAGLVFANGNWGFWFPIGYTAGYLLLLLFVAAPLRRSGAYTLPDFTSARLDSRRVRRLTSLLVIVIGWLYVVPQLQGASLALGIAAGLPDWVGALLVAVVVASIVAVGGMRSITFVQSFQFWFKLAAIALPTLLIVLLTFQQVPQVISITPRVIGAIDPYYDSTHLTQIVSLMVALLLGTMGLPHVLVRFYTNPDGESTRRTTVLVLILLSAFYVFPTLLGLWGKVVAPDVLAGERTDAYVLLLPSALVPGPLGAALTALVLAGAFAAFVSTSSGLVISLAGVISQELAGGSVRGFRWAAIASVAVPLAVALLLTPGNLAGSVGLVFAFTAATIAPVMLLSVWWRRLTAQGAVAAMVTGSVLTAIAVALPYLFGWLFMTNNITSEQFQSTAVLLVLSSQPALISVPLSFAAAVFVSLATQPPKHADRFLARIHTPD